MAQKNLLFSEKLFFLYYLRLPLLNVDFMYLFVSFIVPIGSHLSH